MKYLRLLLSILLLAIAGHSFSQSSLVESLKSALENAGEDTARVNILNELASILCRTDPLEAIYYSSDATLLAAEIDYQPGLAAAYKNIGLGHYIQGIYFEAFNNWGISLKIYEFLEDERQIADLASNLGSVYYDIGIDDQAIEYYQRAARISEKLNDRIRLASLFLNIGLVYSEQPGSSDSALYYFKHALTISESIDYLDIMAKATLNIGEIYFNLEAYDSALVYFDKSFTQASYNLEKTISLNFLGKIYAEKGDYQTALNYQQDALNMVTNEDDQGENARVLLGLASTYRMQGNPRQAIVYYEQAKSIAQEIGLEYELSEAYGGLSDAYFELKDFQNAYYFLSLQDDIENTISGVEKERTTSKLISSYQWMEKEKADEINVLVKKSEIEQLKNRRQRALTIAVGSMGLLFLLLAAGFYSRFSYIRKTNKMIESQKAEIESQRDEIESQRDLLYAQKKSITDSIDYAQRLQSAVLPSKSYMDGLMAEYFIFFKPRDIVSGDFYWVKEINNQLIIVGVDCTGHGVPGGFMSMLGVTLLNDLLGRGNIGQPGEVLGQLRTRVKEMFSQEGVVHGQKDGMEMAISIIDHEKRELSFAGANNPLYLVRNKNRSIGSDLESHRSLDNGKFRLYEVRGDKQPIGAHWEETAFTSHTLKLHEQDTIYMFSDGIVDQFGGENRKKYKVENFKNLLLSIQKESMIKQKQIIEESFENWRGNHEQIDDVCVIGVRF